MCITPVYIGRRIVIAITRATVATINFCAKPERFFITSTAIIDLERVSVAKTSGSSLDMYHILFSQSVVGMEIHHCRLDDF